MKTDALNKSIDDLTETIFKRYVEGMKHPKNINISGDSSKTADEAVNQVQKSPNDDSRGAGRPKQISDVPEEDEDGNREGKYDSSITSNKGKEDQPSETKQSPSLDQVNDKGHKNEKPNAPQMRPFKKSEELTEEEAEKLNKSFTKFLGFLKFEAKAQELVKSISISKEEFVEYEELKKSRKTFESEAGVLMKATQVDQTEVLQKSISDLTQQVLDQGALLSKIANTPRASKSIKHVDAVEKSRNTESSQQEFFSKSEVGDALDSLVKSNKLPDVVALEYDTTGNIYSSEYRAVLDNYLSDMQSRG